MKRIGSILLALILVAALSGTALAAPEAADAGELYQQWETSGYPDDVGSVYYDDATGNLVITLKGADEARREEIRAMLESTGGLAFGTSKYSHNEMLAVLQEIQADMGDASQKIYSAGIGWDVVNDVVTGFGESGKESRIVVTVDESVLTQWASLYQARYGDMVYVTAGKAPVALDSIGVADPQFNQWLFPTIVLILVAGVFTLLLVNRRRMVPVMQAAGGATVTAPHRLSKQEVIEAVRESGVSPSESVHEKIMQEIQRGS